MEDKSYNKTAGKCVQCLNFKCKMSRYECTFGLTPKYLENKDLDGNLNGLIVLCESFEQIKKEEDCEDGN